MTAFLESCRRHKAKRQEYRTKRMRRSVEEAVKSLRPKFSGTKIKSRAEFRAAVNGR